MTKKLYNEKKFYKNIDIARKVHKNKYSYSKATPSNKKTKICITCQEHGDFYQSLWYHINTKAGCPKCRGIAASERQRKPQKVFVKEARKKHANFYDYSIIKYVTARIPVEIICPAHGIFKQSPDNHLKGKRCHKCSKSRSKAELVLESLLKKHLINFETQKRFPWCRNPRTGRNLVYDFYLPDYAVLIEYDGEHHFKEFYKDSYIIARREEYSYVKYKDRIKTKLPKKNGYKLYRISYNQDIEKELLKILNKILDR